MQKQAWTDTHSTGGGATGPTGGATIPFQPLPPFQLRQGNLVVVFGGARKPGEDPLGGISSRRLVAVRVA